jgi:hypothetical protein
VKSNRLLFQAGILSLGIVLASAACEAKNETPPSGASVSAAPAGTTGTAPSQAAAKTCGSTAMTGRGIGDLSIGRTLDSVRVLCAVGRDTTRLATEGQLARMITVAIGGEVVEAEIVDEKIWRIEVRSSRFRTADSLGVGTPLSRLLALGNARGITGEGQLFVVSPEHCGLSFRLSDNGSRSRSQNWDRTALSRLPAGTVVNKVLIVGCDQS